MYNLFAQGCDAVAPRAKIEPAPFDRYHSINVLIVILYVIIVIFVSIVLLCHQLLFD